MEPTQDRKNLEKCITAVPNYGLQVPLNHRYPEIRSQSYMPSLRQMWPLLPTFIRYTWFYIINRLTQKSVVMDLVAPVKAKGIHGVPIGGIGCGTIGRGFRGEFCRFQMEPGLYKYNTVDANQFIVTIKNAKRETIFHSLLSSFPKKTLQSWESLIDASRCFYTGLYPRSWTQYDLSKFGVMLKCRQISPIIPNNYKDSSLPCAVFIWDIQNICAEDRTVTIAFTFKNGVGEDDIDNTSNCTSRSSSSDQYESVILNHTINAMPCSYILSARRAPEVEISKCLYFNPNSDGIKPWTQLKVDGRFDERNQEFVEVLGEMACGIAAQVIVHPVECATCVMSLVWDMPTIHFPKKLKTYSRYYTRYFGSQNSGLKIVKYAFENYTRWEEEIYKWQYEVLGNASLPDWYKSALFNETYYVSDGGTIWVTLDEDEAKTLPANDPRIEYGKFAILESHEYKMYNSYDVHFYASFALTANWPLLQLVLQYDIRDAIFVELPEKLTGYDGRGFERKVVNSVPHDLGDPGEEPFILVNAYPTNDSSKWKDLAFKFVLQVFRDAFLSGLDSRSVQYLHDMYNACYLLMYESEKYDRDDDGLIENCVKGDQTYDLWYMKGPSAYCGGLWLSALFAMTKIAEVLHKTADKRKFQKLLTKGKVAFEEKLWNGKYYNFDSSANNASSIMSDQLCGYWYLRTCGFTYEVFPRDHVRTTLQTIFENNVQGFCGGKMGAVNGWKNGGVDKFTPQSEEVWTGVTYALAATMIQEGLWDEGFVTAGGMYKSMTERFGLAFNTPEALYATKFYRAGAYERPLSIWSMQLAINAAKNNDKLIR